MSLITCPECKRQISDKAAFCPHCGCPADEFQNKKVDSIHQELKCPICHNPIKAGTTVCPVCHYGLPAQWSNYNCKINGRLYDLRPVEAAIKENKQSSAEVRAMQITGLSLTAAKKLVEVIQTQGEIPLEFDPAQHGVQINTPKCPTCGSTSLDKINAFDRGVAGGLFGFASKTARSQFRCKKCGYMW